MEERVLCVVYPSGIMMEGFIVYKLNSLCYRIFPTDQPPEETVPPPLLPTEHHWCSSKSAGGTGSVGQALFPDSTEQVQAWA